MRGAVVSVFGGPDCITVRSDLPEPTLSSPNQILIDVHAAGVNPVDTYIRSGVYAKLPKLPYTPGRDGSGVVREVGSSVSHVKAGDRVWFFDAEYGSTTEVTVAAKVFPLPKELSFIEGASLAIPYLTAYRALVSRGHIKKSDRVLIHGASGGVGLACCQIARHIGASLIVGTAGTDHGMDVVQRNGAHHTVCHRTAGYVDELKRVAPEGFDLIIEMLANVNLPADLSILATGGRVGVVGNRGECTISPRLLMQKESSVYGVMMGGCTPADVQTTQEFLVDLFKSTQYRPVINKVYPLDDVSQSHVDVITQPGGAAGNLVVQIR